MGAASKQRAATNKTENSRDTIDSTCAAAKVATYTYLGTAYTASWQRGMEPACERTRRTVINMVQMVGQLTQLDLGELQQSIDTIVEGVVGFAGRGTVITWEDCEAMEEGARRKALAKHGSTVTWPRAHVYTETRTSAGGEGNNHAYQTAAASWMSVMDNALAAPAGQTAGMLARNMVAATAWRLGCRGVSPLEWHPAHLEEQLNEDL